MSISINKNIIDELSISSYDAIMPLIASYKKQYNFDNVFYIGLDKKIMMRHFSNIGFFLKDFKPFLISSNKLDIEKANPSMPHPISKILALSDEHFKCFCIIDSEEFQNGALNVKDFKQNILKIEVGLKSDISSITKNLINLGYSHSKSAIFLNSFNVKGDVITIDQENFQTIRIDTEFNKVESVSIENTGKGLSKSVESVKIFPLLNSFCKIGKDSDPSCIVEYFSDKKNLIILQHDNPTSVKKNFLENESIIRSIKNSKVFFVKLKY